MESAPADGAGAGEYAQIGACVRVLLCVDVALLVCSEFLYIVFQVFF